MGEPAGRNGIPMNHEEEIWRSCEDLYQPGQVVELRALRKHGIASGYFTDFAKLAEIAVMLENDPEYQGIYVTLNEVNPDLFSRRANRVDTRMGNRDKTTADADIVRRRWFPVDIDPKRLSGISSSDAEHAAAREKAAQIREFLRELGWPDPLFADSGNGYHLLYRIDLPNDEESGLLIKNALTALSSLFSDEEVEIDTSVSNAARIWRLYGTLSRKGDNTPIRPHRRSAVIDCPEEGGFVPVSELMHLSSLGKEPTRRDIPAEREHTLDLGSYLFSHGLSFKEKPYHGGRLFAFDQCPFSSDHTDGAYAIQFGNGAIFAGCHHASCGGGRQRWQELKTRLDRETHAKTGNKTVPGEGEDGFSRLRENAREKARAKAAYENGAGFPKQNTDVVMAEREEIGREAERILRDEDPFRYVLKTFALDHEGDKTVSRCLAVSLASRIVTNSGGLHVLVTGESGKGKSHAFDTMLEQVPYEYRLDGRMSDKALFYTEGLKPGTVISLDDVSLSEQMQEILKGVTTSFRKPFLYRTVDKDRRGQMRYIPERCVWWVAKVEGCGDDQVWNRMLTCWIDDSREQDKLVLARELGQASLLPGDEAVRHEVQVCRQIWNSLGETWVIIPYAGRIRFSSDGNRRNIGMLLDIIRSHAAMMQYQREHLEINGKICTQATVDDFRVAAGLYQELNGRSGGQASKLTRSEADLIDAIRRIGKEEIRISEMQSMTGRSYSHVYKMLHGYASYGKTYSGLLEKCPALSFLDRTDTMGGGEISRRTRVYSWDEELYASWNAGGGCWLDDTDDDPGPGGNGGGMRQDGGASRLEKNDGNDQDLRYNTGTILESTLLREDEGTYGARDNASLSQTEPETPASTPGETRSETSTASLFEKEHDGDDGASRQTPALPPPLPPVQPSPSPTGDDHLQGSEQAGLALVCQVGISKEAFDPGKYRSCGETRPGRCDGCGAERIRYIEKISRGMKREGRKPGALCEQCYSRAVARKVMGVLTLPGTVPYAGMKRTGKQYGRCQVCNLRPVTWWNDEEKTGLCDACYSREYRTGRGDA